MSKKAKRLSRKKVHAGYCFDVVVDRVSWPNGKTYSRDLILHGGIAVVVPCLDDKHLVLLRQFRYGAGGRTLWEIPAGTIDGREKPLACAKREIEEETGYRAHKWEKILSFYASPGFSTELIHAFLARDLYPSRASLEEDEVLETRIVTFKEAAALIRTKKIVDAKSLVPLFYFLGAKGLL